MKLGKAFEILVKRILINVGFSEVKSDGLYIFDGTAGQMIQGLGEAHNADVLLEPPVQTPFYARSRILIECKDHNKRIGLNTVRSVLGLREDINHFDIVDLAELTARRQQHRRGFVYSYERYYYQIAMAAIKGYTGPAQKFAATHRIPLLEFNKMPFWNEFYEEAGYIDVRQRPHWVPKNTHQDTDTEGRITCLANRVGERMAVAITNSGQMLFLYLADGEHTAFSDYYSLHWYDPQQPWELRTGEQTYLFQLPGDIMKLWLDNATTELKMKKDAINYKAGFLSNMIVYYAENGRPMVKMISIDRRELENASERLQR